MESGRRRRYVEEYWGWWTDSSPTKKKRAASDCVPDTATSTVTAAVVDAHANATADDIGSSSKITDGSNGTTIAATATNLSPIGSSSKITDGGIITEILPTRNVRRTVMACPLSRLLLKRKIWCHS